MPPNFEITQTIFRLNRVELRLVCTSPVAACPWCGVNSRRIHARYSRWLDDLAVGAFEVLLAWQVRRFVCDNSSCAKRTFSEQRPELALAYTHRTTRQAKILSEIGLALGGRAGQRLSEKLRVRASRDTLLRLVRKRPLALPDKAIAVGLDEFAFKKASTYGTLIVDLFSHRPLELLADRKADTVVGWLKQHPEIKIISRDRAGNYGEAATRGAPQAIQVLDRFHLLVNLTESLRRLLEHRKDWQATLAFRDETVKARGETAQTQPSSIEVGQPPKKAGVQARLRELQASKRARRLALHQEVQALLQKGLSRRQIAQRLKMSRTTVRKYLQTPLAEGDEPLRSKSRASSLDRYKAYVFARWQDGQHNALRIWEEITAQGYSGSIDNVRRYVSKWRGADNPTQLRQGLELAKRRKLSARQLAFLMVKPFEKLTNFQLSILKIVLEANAELKQVYELAQGFKRLVAERQKEKLNSWLTLVKASGFAELINFAKGLEIEREALQAALSLPFSNGPVEGHVNRLKNIKRAMYGRSNFDLLRQRVLSAA